MMKVSKVLEQKFVNTAFLPTVNIDGAGFFDFENSECFGRFCKNPNKELLNSAGQVNYHHLDMTRCV